MATSTTATVAILSIGDMGRGVALLLAAHNFRVITNIGGRRQSTHDRARKAKVELVSTDEELVAQSDYVLSIVPPRDAYATAKRIADCFKADKRRDSGQPLYFLDLNAIAPSSARRIEDLFKPYAQEAVVVDGGIIGGPPQQDESSGTWKRPSIILSGPQPLSQANRQGISLFETLNGKQVGTEIGVASGLKCCFASLTKGFTSLAIQSYSTAAQLGVLPQLQEQLAGFNPKMKDTAERGIMSMPPKAYRWVDEMAEIGKTFREDGSWSSGWGDGIYDSVADVYKFVANATVLGEEKTESRKRKNVDDVVDALAAGLKRPKPS